MFDIPPVLPQQQKQVVIPMMTASISTMTEAKPKYDSQVHPHGCSSVFAGSKAGGSMVGFRLAP